MKKSTLIIFKLLTLVATANGDPDYARLLSLTDSIQERYQDRTFPGIDAENTRIFSFKKIVRATCPEEAETLFSLAQGNDRSAWEAFCSRHHRGMFYNSVPRLL